MKLLVIGAHPDDIEIGCGGTLSRYKSEGVEIRAVVFTKCVDEVPKGFAPSSIADEFKRSMDLLGIKFQIYDMPNKKLEDRRQGILETLDRLYDAFKPDLVLCPSSYNAHQDHQTIHRETKRAFRDRSIWGYRLPYGDYQFAHDIYVKLNRDDMQKKFLMLQQYETQKNRHYMQSDLIMSMARVAGAEVNWTFAEAFENIRMVI